MNTTKLYLLSIVSYPYDAFDSHLVRATSEQEARDLCPHADEGKDVWQTAEVEIIEESGSLGVIISSFNAG